MEVLDVSSIGRRLRALGLAEKFLRIVNSTPWLLYWFMVPMLAITVILNGILLIDNMGAWVDTSWAWLSPEEREALTAAPNTAFLLVLWAANKAVFGHRRAWAAVALAAIAWTLGDLALAWMREGPTIWAFDRSIFWYAAVATGVTACAGLLFVVALASVFALSPRERELLRPLASPKLFPRRRFRSMTVIPDVIDFISKRSTRMWVAMLYLASASFGSVVPYTAIRAGHFFESDVSLALKECQGDPSPAACLATTMDEKILVIAISLPIAFAVGLGLERFVTRRARRRLTFSLDDVALADQRPPILFLRSFKDDQVRLEPEPRSRILAWLWRDLWDPLIDHVIVEHLTRLGPVIALGKPGEPARPFGAARTYLPIDDWQDTVLRMLDEARFVVVILDDSAGLSWELSQIVSHGHRGKCIFMVPPDYEPTVDAGHLLQALGGEAAWFDAQARTRAFGSATPVLGWFHQGSALRICRAERFSPRAMELFLRWFENDLAGKDSRTP